MNIAIRLHASSLPSPPDLLAWTTPDIAVPGSAASAAGPASTANIT